MRFNNVPRTVGVDVLYLALPVTTDGGASILIVRGKYSIPTAEANGDREFAESQMEEAGASHLWYFFLPCDRRGKLRNPHLHLNHGLSETMRP